MHTNWRRGQPAALDVTVISPLLQLTLAGAACTPGHALKVGEERKMVAHAEDCRAVGVAFVPLVVEALAWGDEVLRRRSPSAALAVSRVSDWASLQLRAHDTSSRNWP